MDYYQLKSIVGAQKKVFSLQNESESFYILKKLNRPYINQTFAKEEFYGERPTIILVSAVGATGKSILAEKLSSETSLPLFDLSKHKPVGDNTLTGLLTRSFSNSDIAGILGGLADGTYGIVIDSIDEGRSKTTEKAFEAFLDDISQYCVSKDYTSFVLLGRTQILIDCWLYFANKGINTGLVTIDPFSLENAREYIDTFALTNGTTYKTQYEQARDIILEQLGSAFQGSAKRGGEDFLSFIGYPPVLDAIATLLQKENNYHKLLNDLTGLNSSELEVERLLDIVTYIQKREKDQKVFPNIIEGIFSGVPQGPLDKDYSDIFDIEEQCIRLVAFNLKKQITLDRITDRALNERYESQLKTFFKEHPFLDSNTGNFRNAVFESFALATCMMSENPICSELVQEYVGSHKSSYHLIYLLNVIAVDKVVPIGYLHAILGAAQEFNSTYSSVELRVDGPSREDMDDGIPESDTIEIEVEVLLGKDRTDSKTFSFKSTIRDKTAIKIGSSLAFAKIFLPCDVLLASSSDIELTAPVELSANKIHISAKNLVLRNCPHEKSTPEIIFEGESLDSSLENITTNGIPLTFALRDNSGLVYPAVNYAQKIDNLPEDPLLRTKYLRLKRILMEFRSHSKGSLAKYNDKIEHKRVLHDDTGHAVLRQLLNDGILSLSNKFYTLHPEGIDNYLGVSWQDLRRGHTGEKMMQYLREIVI